MTGWQSSNHPRPQTLIRNGSAFWSQRSLCFQTSWYDISDGLLENRLPGKRSVEWSEISTMSMSCRAQEHLHYIAGWPWYHSCPGYQNNNCGYCKKKNQSKLLTPSSRVRRISMRVFFTVASDVLDLICRRFPSDWEPILDPSYYATSTHVRPDHYQELINRGWRRYVASEVPIATLTTLQFQFREHLLQARSSQVMLSTLHNQVYQPSDVEPWLWLRSRLNAEDFKPRKDQRRAVNRWNDYILGKDYIRKAVRLCPQTREEKHRRRNIFDLSHELHRCEYENVKRPIDPTTKKPLEPAHKFEVNLEADSSSEAKWKLFAAYQSTVHKEPAAKHTQKMFERFLCSGLKRSTVTEHGRTKRLGSYHQCYRIDGKLVAVAVLDLLPQAVSAVYIL